MPTHLGAPREDLLDVLAGICRSFESVSPDAWGGAWDPRPLLIRLERALGAQWIVVRGPEGEWLEVRSGACRDGHEAEHAARRLDRALIAGLPRGRLVRLAGAALDRYPRLAGSGIRELPTLVDDVSKRAPGFVAIALPRPLSVDPRILESVLRSLLATESLRARSRQTEESQRIASAGQRAACALHDLRHELTIAGLELERVSCGVGPASGEGLERVRTAFAAARSICERALTVESPEAPQPCRVADLLRREALAACAVAGRGDAVQVETRCRDDLVIRAPREALSRIVRNLVLNAVESSPDGERVIAEMEQESTGGLVLRVIDRGRGMSSSEREGFRRFGRSGRGGFGIGTASVEACARSLDASIRIESRLGAGTLAEIRLSRATVEVEG